MAMAKIVRKASIAVRSPVPSFDNVIKFGQNYAVRADSLPGSALRLGYRVTIRIACENAHQSVFLSCPGLPLAFRRSHWLGAFGRAAAVAYFRDTPDFRDRHGYFRDRFRDIHVENAARQVWKRISHGLNQHTICSSKLDWIFRALANIAFRTQPLEISPFIRSASR